MHELSLCSAIASVVSRHAEGRTVQAVHLRVGQLRQVVPDTLVYCWGLVVPGTALAGARLVVEEVPAWIRCPVCGAERALGTEVRFACAGCGSGAVQVVAGEEFLVTTLDLA